jgi:hypothetical protein
MIVRHKSVSGLTASRPACRRRSQTPIGARGWVGCLIKGSCEVRGYLDARISALAITLAIADADIRYTMPVVADAILQRSDGRAGPEW